MAMNPKQLAAFGKKPGGGGGPPPKKKDDKKKGGGGPPPEPPKHDEPDGDEGDEDADESDDAELVEECAQQLRDGDGDPDLMEKMKDYDPESGMPEWVADDEVWNKAKGAVDPEGEGAGFDEPWAVVAHVYRRMGGGDK